MCYLLLFFLTSNTYDFKRKQYNIALSTQRWCILKGIPLWIFFLFGPQGCLNWQHKASACRVCLPRPTPWGVQLQCWKWTKCSDRLIAPLPNWKMQRKGKNGLILNYYGILSFLFCLFFSLSLPYFLFHSMSAFLTHVT